MEVSDRKITQEEIQALFGPTMPIEAAVILRNAQSAREAREQLIRLSPPAPEVDEATVWTRKVLHAHQRAMTPPDSGWGNMSYEKGSYDHLDVFKAPRQVLSELIASKDAEIADAKLSAKHSADWSQAAIERAEKAESEAAALRAENERLKADAYRNGWEDAEIKHDTSKGGTVFSSWEEGFEAYQNNYGEAAERNTAEPVAEIRPCNVLVGSAATSETSAPQGGAASALADRVGTSATQPADDAAVDVDHWMLVQQPKCAHIWKYESTDYHGAHKGEDTYRCTVCGEWEYRTPEPSQRAESWSVIDTAPVVEVTQAESAARTILRSIAAIKSYEPKLATILPIISDELDEAEARGRQEALEAVKVRLQYFPDWKQARELIPTIDRLMTEGK